MAAEEGMVLFMKWNLKGMQSYLAAGMKMTRKIQLAVVRAGMFALALGIHGLQAREGMWIPTLLNAVEGDMQAMGMHLTAEDIYSINEGSLKDAVVHFNGGCTAEMVSAEGLLLTNHHCGYGQIAYHSTVENDYLKDGFWAMSREEELPNADLFARFIDRIEDVTARVQAAEDPEAEKAAIVAEATEGTDLEGSVVAFDFGNSHYLITTRTFYDVRLVGAPPSAVGKFGGDTDNWVWPRHTGDFSIFRIYADADNNPAEYSENNVPYQPKHHFPVNIGGISEGDFTMVFGFPGRTEQYLTSDAVAHVIEVLNPMRIGMRDASLAVINAARAESAALRIAYADKQSGVANAWKKWIGQSRGLSELHAIDKKKALEAEFTAAATAAGKDYANVIASIQAENAQYFPFLEERWRFIEMVYYGPDILNFAMGFKGIIESAGDKSVSDSTWTAQLGERAGGIADFFRQYDPAVDEKILAALVPPYLDGLASASTPEVFADFNGDAAGFAADLFDASVFANQEALQALAEAAHRKKWARLAQDPALQCANSIIDAYYASTRPGLMSHMSTLDSLTGLYTKGLREMFPDRAFFPDANSTLRLTYGRVEGSSPYDGMEYTPVTTHRGILQKYVPGDPDFDLPADLVSALEAENWGRYADDTGDLPVCFTGSNHTTGGNSGSPAIDGNGYLIGINFDRSWESTMSDILFEDSRCRNIMVDIRYVLWVTDVYAGAGHLVDEMDLVR